MLRLGYAGLLLYMWWCRRLPVVTRTVDLSAQRFRDAPPRRLMDLRRGPLTFVELPLFAGTVAGSVGCLGGIHMIMVVAMLMGMKRPVPAAMAMECLGTVVAEDRLVRWLPLPSSALSGRCGWTVEPVVPNPLTGELGALGRTDRQARA
ncbi:hypothetical protein [Streptomyces gilvifuscus]|uniref:Uncharacterized protein n=1 Tax=Streptomyces gilvifuscus TaxID=1550617 RepID=A0ABT5G960_9ACTN|nr:hypothetical protein [Streptomyces gilvifuscus]MDC2961432.1 hypothetical protein [Streptomyces gilvifuscus]